MLTTYQPPPLRTRIARQRRDHDRRAGIVLPGVAEGSPIRAREFVRRRLSAWGVPVVRVEDAEVIVSELATNVLQHTMSRRGPHRPIRPHTVDALAVRWGYRLASPGTCVWAHLPYSAGEFSR